MALTAVLAGKSASLLFNNDGMSTDTSAEQRKVEQSVLVNYEAFKEVANLSPKIRLYRDQHIQYLKKGLRHLSEAYTCLDASRPWLCFWIVHSLELLDEPIPEETAAEVALFLGKCQDETNGGFGGGPGQLPHLAPTYAAVSALCILSKSWKQAYDIINREKLKEFLHDRVMPNGACTMHQDGEEDIRGAYCAIVVARLTNVFTQELFQNTADWLVRCQTYEGGFGGLPGLEAHGGYTFCGFAALILLGQEHRANISLLLKWVANRQMRLEGGFQGRTNKLVDGCYSYWQGSLFPILHNILTIHGDEHVDEHKWMFDQMALEEYILINCQSYSGGLLDKPGKSRDYYHTCYCLSGLSLAENFIGDGEQNDNVKVRGGKKNLLKPIHPIYNLCVDSACDALEHFNSLPIPK